MIYTELTVKAAALAYRQHKDQYDKIGMPYIFHPFHVAEAMDDEISVCVALLHDVVEDTDISFEELERDFPVEVIAPLRLLTHDKDVEYMEYIRGLLGDAVAVKVKRADIEHNSDPGRMKLLGSEEKIRYFKHKYEEARKLLGI